MATDIQICNMAIARCGVSYQYFIQSLDERSKEATLCKAFYEPTRDRVLEDFPWPFATVTVPLANLGTPPTGWGFRYQYPTSCLFARDIVNPYIRIPSNSERIPFIVQGDPDNAWKCILTDQPNAYLRYVMKIDTENIFPPNFVNALAWCLASEIAPALTSKPENGLKAAEMYTASLLIAGARVLNEGFVGQLPESDIIKARL